MNNYALIGCSRIARNHIKDAVTNLEKTRIAAVCDKIPECMEDVLNQYDPVHKHR